MSLRSILNWPGVYRLFDQLIGGRRGGLFFIREHVRASAGQRVLDIGCGPAKILMDLPAVTYVGMDPSAAYIEAAQRTYGSRGTFYCQGIDAITREALGTFDIVLVKGVVHHVDDDQAVQLFERARSVLRPGGYLVTFDGCFCPNQSFMARWFLKRDRGAYVRTQENYERLAKRAFPRVTSHLYHHLIRLPYTHLVMECRG